MLITPRSLVEDLERTADAAFAVDGEGKITAWNSAAETALGYSRRSALGRFCFEVLGGRDVLGNRVCQRECLVFRNIRERTPVRRFRMHVRASTGHYVEGECATVCLLGAASEPTIIHLLRMWPGGNQNPAPRDRRGDERGLRRGEPSLTPRETEVLGLLAAGRSTQEMAEELHVSPATVRSHVEHLLRKLGAHSRLEAVVVAAREGLL